MRGVCICVCVCLRAADLTRYHMKMVLKAFSLEQEPQAMVMSWDIPLGATCRQRNSCGLSSFSTPPPPAGAVGSTGRLGHNHDILEAVGLGDWTPALPGGGEAQGGGQRGKKGEEKPSLSS